MEPMVNQASTSQKIPPLLPQEALGVWTLFSCKQETQLFSSTAGYGDIQGSSTQPLHGDRG